MTAHAQALPCDGGCGPDDPCLAVGMTFEGVRIDCCPVRAATADRRVRAIVTLAQQAHVSPLAGWPDRYVAWVADELSWFVAELELAAVARVSS